MLLVALFATGLASVGPMYYDAARISILRDGLARAPLLERGVEIKQQGSVAQSIAPLTTQVDGAFTAALPDPTQRARVLDDPILALESSVSFASRTAPIAWRSDFCTHLVVTRGRCATAAGTVVVAESLAKLVGLRVGQRLAPPGWPTLTIVGVYKAPDFNADYWFARGGIYFPYEDPLETGASNSDALFTPQATIDTAEQHPQGTVVIDQPFAGSRISADDVTDVSRALTTLPEVLPATATSASAYSALADDIVEGWHSLAVPLLVIGLQVIVLVWLLLFFAVRDGVDSRGSEIALARLRGVRGIRLIRFALSEPLVLLAAAVPLGVLLGRVGAGLLAHEQLRGGTPVGLPALAWAAAGAAALGGVAAVGLAGYRTVRRPVTDQWQTTTRDAVRRGWVLDAVVLTAAAVGVVELRLSGAVTGTDSSPIGFVTPGLIGLIAAILAARLVPLACRAVFPATRRHGGIASFLAVRHLARRAVAVRSMFVLAFAFALASFTVAAWSAGRSDRELVADVHNGAPVVMSVYPVAGDALADTVAKLDPQGRDAAVVDASTIAGSDGQELLAVDPHRFAAVAAWNDDFADRPLAALMDEVSPSLPPSLTLTGTEIRVRVHVNRTRSPEELQAAAPEVLLTAQVATPTSGGPVDVDLGRLGPAGRTRTLTAPLQGCPCTLRNLSAALPASFPTGSAATVSLRLDGIDVLGASGWTPVARSQRPSQWRADPATGMSGGSDGGVAWDFRATRADITRLNVADLPAQLPAVVDPLTTGPEGSRSVTTQGLNAKALTVRPVAVASAVPGAEVGGIIVDRTLAERASGGQLTDQVTQQVWATAGAADRIAAGLRSAHLRITSTRSAADELAVFNRQGPALASIMAVTAAGAAAVLGAAAAVLGLIGSARRRRLEYAALEAAGAPRRSLVAGLLGEQATVMVVGVVAGVVGGGISTAVALANLPVFTTPPASPPLPHDVDVAQFGLLLGVTLVVLLAVVSAAGRLLFVRVGPRVLREGAT